MEEQGVVQGMLADDTGESLTFPSLRFGEVSITESRILTFPRGLVGLPQATRFTFLHDEECPGPFFWMQSLDDPALAFVVCEPQNFFPDYNVSLSEAEQEELGLQWEGDALVCVILVVPEDPQHITANLRGPIVMNVASRVGFQLVLPGEQYPSAAPLFSHNSEGGADARSD